MEVKVPCSCGTRYKFDVEPVNHLMPGPVSCPSCGADGTAASNAILQQSVNTQPTAVRVAGGQPVAVDKARIRLSAPAHSERPPEVAAPQPQAAPAPPSRRASSAGNMPRAQVQRTGKWKTIALYLLAGILVLSFGWKWSKRIRRLASIVGAASVDNASAAASQINLWADDGVLLIIKHTNHTEIANGGVEFWRNQLRKKLTVVPGNDAQITGNDYEVLPAHNGFVQIVGTLNWPKEQFEALTQFLSQKYNTLAIEQRDVDFSGAYVFGVFEQGTKKFRAEMEVKINAARDNVDEVVRTEGDAWAIQHGYKPGENGFKEFDISDADDLTKRLGVKLWDQPDEHKNFLILRE